MIIDPNNIANCVKIIIEIIPVEITSKEFLKWNMFNGISDGGSKSRVFKLNF